MGKRITQNLAGRVAQEMVNSAFDSKIAAKQNEVKDYTTAIAKEQTPSKVLELMRDKEISKYIRTTTSVAFREADSDAEPLYTCSHPIPSGSNNGGRALYQAAPTQLSAIRKMEDELDKLREEKSSARYTVKNTLLQLNTFKRIREAFPEAYVFIPTEEIDVDASTALAVPIDNIRGLLGLEIKQK